MAAIYNHFRLAKTAPGEVALRFFVDLPFFVVENLSSPYDFKNISSRVEGTYIPIRELL